jgi:hypothetical protein
VGGGGAVGWGGVRLPLDVFDDAGVV